MRKTFAILAVLAMLLAGCGSRTAGNEFRQVVYSYTGGMAGYDRSIIIMADGSYQVAERGRPGKAGHLSGAELNAVRSLVEQIKWEGLAAQYVDPKVADAILEGVTVTVGKQEHRTLVGTGGQAPAELAALLGKLKAVLEAHR